MHRNTLRYAAGSSAPLPMMLILFLGSSVPMRVVLGQEALAQPRTAQVTNPDGSAGTGGKFTIAAEESALVLDTERMEIVQEPNSTRFVPRCQSNFNLRLAGLRRSTATVRRPAEAGGETQFSVANQRVETDWTSDKAVPAQYRLQDVETIATWKYESPYVQDQRSVRLKVVYPKGWTLMSATTGLGKDAADVPFQGDVVNRAVLDQWNQQMIGILSDPELVLKEDPELHWRNVRLQILKGFVTSGEGLFDQLHRLLFVNDLPSTLAKGGNPLALVTVVPYHGGPSLAERLWQAVAGAGGAPLSPPQVMRLAIRAAEGDYNLAMLTAHNLLKEVCYAYRDIESADFLKESKGAPPPRGSLNAAAVRVVQEGNALRADRMMNAAEIRAFVDRLQDFREAAAPADRSLTFLRELEPDQRDEIWVRWVLADKMGPWYHVFCLLFGDAVVPGAGQFGAWKEKVFRRGAEGQDLFKSAVDEWAGSLDLGSVAEAKVLSNPPPGVQVLH